MVVRFSVQVSTASPDHATAVMVVHFLVMVATAPMAATAAMLEKWVTAALAATASMALLAFREQPAQRASTKELTQPSAETADMEVLVQMVDMAVTVVRSLATAAKVATAALAARVARAEQAA
jgi:hypothetical protein